MNGAFFRGQEVVVEGPGWLVVGRVGSGADPSILDELDDLAGGVAVVLFGEGAGALSDCSGCRDCPGCRGGLAAIDSLAGFWGSIGGFFKNIGAGIVSVWRRVGGVFERLYGWVAQNAERVCVSDCGRIYRISVVGGMLTRREVDPTLECASRTIVPSRVIPGWTSTCGTGAPVPTDPPAPEFPNIPPSPTEGLGRMLPFLVIGGILLAVA